MLMLSKKVKGDASPFILAKKLTIKGLRDE